MSLTLPRWSRSGPILLALLLLLLLVSYRPPPSSASLSHSPLCHRTGHEKVEGQESGHPLSLARSQRGKQTRLMTPKRCERLLLLLLLTI